MVVVIGAIVFVERGHRRVTVQYAKRVVGRRMYGGSSTHIPLKVNTGGVIPVIFASSILAFPATIAQMFGEDSFMRRVSEQLAWGMPLYNLLYISGIIFFCYFYTAIIFNPDDVAENMRKYGGFIPGIRPGKRTAEYIDTILTRITLVGALYLAAVAILPEFLINGFKVAPIPFIGERLDAVLPRFITEGSERAVLLRRHVAADHRRRGDGHGAAGRVAAHHAALRWVHEEDADPRPTGTLGAGALRSAAGVERRHARPAGGGQGHPGGAAGGAAPACRRSRPATSCGRRCRRGPRSAGSARHAIDSGNLVGDDAVIGIVKERLGCEDARSGFVLDGFPRTVVQATALDATGRRARPAGRARHRRAGGRPGAAARVAADLQRSAAPTRPRTRGGPA